MINKRDNSIRITTLRIKTKDKGKFILKVWLTSSRTYFKRNKKLSKCLNKGKKSKFKKEISHLNKPPSYLKRVNLIKWKKTLSFMVPKLYKGIENWWKEWLLLRFLLNLIVILSKTLIKNLNYERWSNIKKMRYEREKMGGIFYFVIKFRNKLRIKIMSFSF